MLCTKIWTFYFPFDQFDNKYYQDKNGTEVHNQTRIDFDFQFTMYSQLIKPPDTSPKQYCRTHFDPIGRAHMVWILPPIFSPNAA